MQPYSIYAFTFVLMATYDSKTQLLDATGSSLEVLQSCSLGGFQASTGHLQRPRTAVMRSEPLLQRRVVGWFVCHIIRPLTGCAPSTNLETTFFRSWLSTNPGYGSNPFDRSSSLRSQRKLFPGENVNLFNISGWPCVLLLFSHFVSMSHRFVTISDPNAVGRAGRFF